MTKYLLGLLLLFLVSCRPPQDTTPAPINHNLMTLELHACGNQEVGLVGCFYNETNLNEKLTVPLWHKGEYQIKSERCNFLENKRYEGNQKLELTFEKLLAQKPESEHSCLYNIKVFIDEFDNGFEGFFTLSNGNIQSLNFSLQGKDYVGYAGTQIREGADLNNYRLSFKAQTPGALIWEGCQLDGEKEYRSNPELSLAEVIGSVSIPKYSCILTVGLIPDEGSLPVELAKVHINFYEKTVVSLAQPVLKYKKEKLTVKADNLTAAISIGDKYDIKGGNSKKRLKADVPRGQEVDVRIATSNGRFMLLKVKDGEVLWVK